MTHTNTFLDKYLYTKTTITHIQFFRYILIGGFATLIDMGVFYIINNIFHIHYLIAQTAGFLIGLIFNYLLSISWVFKSTNNIKNEIFLFTLIGIGGLLWTYLILWILIGVLNIHFFQDMLSKTISTIFTLVWNFGMRKKFIFPNI